MTLQEREDTGQKYFTVNVEAFSLFLVQNKGNTDTIKRMFEDLVRMNVLLAGDKMPDVRELTFEEENQIFLKHLAFMREDMRSFSL